MNRIIKEGLLPANEKMSKYANPYVSWLVSISRDNTVIVWKLFDGKVMHTDLALNLMKRSSNNPAEP